MYTQCPECGTVFRLSADTLRVAQGDVRCGICSTVFNALEALSDAPNLHLAHSAPGEDTMTVEETSGSEIIELGMHGEAVAPARRTSAEIPWPQDDLPADGPGGAAGEPMPYDYAAAQGPSSIEVSIADDEVTKMLEASGTWERLRTDFKALAAPSPAPAHDAGNPTAAEAMVESAAESMVATPANQAPGSGRAAIHALMADAEQITLESPRNAYDSTTATPAPAVPAGGAVAEPVLDLTEAADADLSWDDDLDEAAAALREQEIEVLAEAIGNGRNPVLPGRLAGPAAPSPSAEAAAPAADMDAPVPAQGEAPAAAALPPFDLPVVPSPPPYDLDVIWRQESAPLPRVIASRKVDLEATDEFPILVLDESDEPRAGAEPEPEFVLDMEPEPGFVFEIEPDAGTGIIVEETPPEPVEPEPALEAPAGAIAAPAAAAETSAVAVAAAPAADSDLAGVAVPGAAAAQVPLQILIPPELRQWNQPSDTERAAQEFADVTAGLEGGRQRRWPWTVAVVLLALCLGLQVVHFYRERLAADPRLGPWLTRAYAVAGLELEAPTDLGAFELRHWGASSDAIARDRLRFRASIVNRAPRPQRYPLLRLTLQDRFGNLVGTRDALPADYLRGAAPDSARMLPGQRVDAELVVIDPGEEAVGFELELCIPAGAGVRCAKDPGAP